MRVAQVPFRPVSDGTPLIPRTVVPSLSRSENDNFPTRPGCPQSSSSM